MRSEVAFTSPDSILPLPSSTERGMADAVKEAFRMIDAFASVGAASFDLTHIDIDGEKRGFRPRQSAVQVKNSLPILMQNAPARRNNIIVRPYGDNVTLVQLDDLDEKKLARVSPAAFLVISTSPGNHQAWVAVGALPSEEMKDFARRLRKGAGADLSASGATRVAGTGNFKRKYEPEFPTVAITQCTPGYIVTKEQLERMALVAAPEPVKKAPAFLLRASNRRERGVWPSYERCLESAPLNHAGGAPDVSRADFTWCMVASDWGWPVESIAQRLMLVSSKAKTEGQRYAAITAENAAAAVEARQYRGR